VVANARALFWIQQAGFLVSNLAVMFCRVPISWDSGLIWGQTLIQRIINWIFNCHLAFYFPNLWAWWNLSSHCQALEVQVVKFIISHASSCQVQNITCMV
jgi:hypothetical protein